MVSSVEWAARSIAEGLVNNKVFWRPALRRMESSLE